MTTFVVVPSFTWTPSSGIPVDAGSPGGIGDVGNPLLRGRVWTVPTFADDLAAPDGGDGAPWFGSFYSPDETLATAFSVAPNTAILSIQLWQYTGGESWRKLGGRLLVGPSNGETGGIVMPCGATICPQILEVSGSPVSLTMKAYPRWRSPS